MLRPQGASGRRIRFDLSPRGYTLLSAELPYLQYKTRDNFRELKSEISRDFILISREKGKLILLLLKSVANPFIRPSSCGSIWLEDLWIAFTIDTCGEWRSLMFQQMAA